MPRYFFDVQSKSGLVCLDYQGLDCPDDEAAKAVARHGAGFTSAGDCARNPQLKRYSFTVGDAQHKLLFTVPFSELLPDDEPSPAIKKRRPRAAAGGPQSNRHA
ncbi:hypothetical protein [Methylobacterium sp. NEAU K]|uniref:DUF6894 family protein n=1 Tax=Methylobacterium sp. NEAU K TaxID=3064946 RepID=UPI00273630D6|nr:hypothetical protein [Methylobacterium sp. NEAU K]MDP4005638.1 hypothetical protein [Methylobacterium sp. NEAU K]